MKRLAKAVIVSAVLLAAVLTGVWNGPAAARTWSDRSGKYTFEGELAGFSDGVVRLRRADGRVIEVKLEQLSAADQAFVRAQAAGGGPAPETDQPEARPHTSGQALVELVTGAKLEGRIVARDDRFITLEVERAGRTYTRRMPLDRIAAITVAGRRETLHEPEGEASPAGGSGTPSGTSAEAEGRPRSRAEVEKLIEQLGATPPDWWDSVELNYPTTLDLSWPKKPPGGWNNQRNVGQYVWDVINPNPGHWREGVKLMHHLMEVHKDHPETQQRAMASLGHMYQDLLQDYARAAFWWRKAGMDRAQSPQGVKLAECYWRLGNKAMALEQLETTPTYYTTIKLLADMGETRRALQLADAAARGSLPDLAYLYAGDTCRMAGQYKEAIAYYQKVLGVKAAGRAQKRVERSHERARANIEGIRLFDALDLARVHDGTYRGTSPGYAGPVEVEVTVAGGRIESVRVVRHQEKQFYSAVEDTPRKIVLMQGVKGVDATTSATITSEAIVNATAKALAGGSRPK